MLSPKTKGEIGEAIFLARTAALGLRVLKPWGDNLPYDFVLDVAGRFLRVQVKTTTVMEGPGWKITATYGRRSRPYASGDIDFLAAYILPLDLWYLIPFASLGATKFIRLRPDLADEPMLAFREAWHLLA